MSQKLPEKLAKILVADDDHGILEVIRIILEENKFKVLAISDGGEVQNSIKTFQPDIIILDIWMSGYDGRDITRFLKNNKETKDIPIIVLSAHNDAKRLAEEAGADDCIEKPFEMDELLGKVRQYIS